MSTNLALRNDPAGFGAIVIGTADVVKITDKGIVPLAGQAPAFIAASSSVQAINAASATRLNFDTKLSDTGGNFGTFRFTAPVNGHYQFNVHVYAAGGTMSNTSLSFYKNNALYSQPVYVVSGFSMQSMSDLIYLSATDYVEVVFTNQYACSVGNGSQSLVGFSGFLARLA